MCKKYVIYTQITWIFAAKVDINPGVSLLNSHYKVGNEWLMCYLKAGRLIYRLMTRYYVSCFNISLIEEAGTWKPWQPCKVLSKNRWGHTDWSRQYLISDLKMEQQWSCSDYCSLCENEEEVETIEHPLCTCAMLSNK